MSTETPSSVPSDALTGSAIDFGPTQADVENYKMLLDGIAARENVGFDPRVNAELVSNQIDRGRLGAFTNPDVGSVGLYRKCMLKVGQQRYIASVLGLKVGPTEIETDSHTANASVAIRSTSELPKLPDGVFGQFIDSNGSKISSARGDAMYSAHFITRNRSHFSQEGAFEELFRRVIEQAEEGEISVKDTVGDPKGAMSLTRQVARILGYGVGPFRREDGVFRMPVIAPKPGFDSRFTHFKR